jgi:hypothetical protein
MHGQMCLPALIGNIWHAFKGSLTKWHLAIARKLRLVRSLKTLSGAGPMKLLTTAENSGWIRPMTIEPAAK